MTNELTRLAEENKQKLDIYQKFISEWKEDRTQFLKDNYKYNQAELSITWIDAAKEIIKKIEWFQEYKLNELPGDNA